MLVNKWSKSTIEINASNNKVWDALIKPELVKQYFFGTIVDSDWKVGSTITFSGEWEGKKYKDKGEIVEVKEHKYLVYTYWSSLGGTADIPENYLKVKYDLELKDGKTLLTIESENKDEESKNQSENNWNFILKNLKELVEKE